MIDEFIGTTLAGKYEIEELLRESEFGNTYRATHLMMETPVTVKILSPTLAVDENIVERFSVEARTISRLSHPNILNVTDFGKDEEIVFIVTEYAEGKTLSEAIKTEDEFTIERAVRITRQIAAALSSAHASNIIHQNLTSQRIQLVPMGTDSELVKVLDIGSFEVDNTRDFEDGESFDELAYLSPEQCTRESEADERSDIYSLGIIFYEMLTGEVPFAADTATDLMMKHSQSPPPPLVAFREDVSEEIEPILLNALAKNPDKRYQSAAAFADDLSEAIKDENEDDTIVIPKVKTAAAGADNNNSWKTAFIVLAGISLLAFGFIYLTNMKQTEPTTIVKTDENGKPVQPLNAATGLSEQNLPNLDQFPSNSLTTLDPTTFPTDMGNVGGGDGNYSNPWDNGPPSANSPIVGAGEGTVTMSDGSIFMPNPDGSDTVILVPVAQKPEDKKKIDETKTNKTDTNTKVEPPNKGETNTDKNDTNTKVVAPKKGETKTDNKKPATKPKPTVEKAVEKNKKTGQSSSNDRKMKSGVEQDT